MRNKSVFIPFTFVLCTATTAFAVTSGNPALSNHHSGGIIFHYQQTQGTENNSDTNRATPIRYDESNSKPVPTNIRTNLTKWV